MKKKKKFDGFTLDIEVIEEIKNQKSDLVNKSAFVNNLLRKSLGMSYIEEDNN